MNAPRPVALRVMTHDDVEAGLRLCRQSHWNQVARDWRQFLVLTPEGAAVAVDAQGGVIGSVATMRYALVHRGIATSDRARETRATLLDRLAIGVPARGRGTEVTDRPMLAPGTKVAGQPPSLAWIAMVLVDPAHRGSGVGTALLQHGLEQASDVTAIGLDATPLGQPLYEKLGFLADARMVRLHRPAAVRIEAQPFGVERSAADADSTPGSSARAEPVDVLRPADVTDLDGIADLDAIATGLDRRAMLAWLFDGAAEYAWVSVGQGGVIQGAVLGRHGHHADHLGPVIATSEATALAVVRACLSAHAATSFFIDVADDRPGWRIAVESLGFTVQRPFTRMYRGAVRPEGDPSTLFAIIGPEFG